MNAPEWSVGSNGNHFCDMAGFRYCVAYVRPDYEVLRNGVVMHVNIPSLGAGKMLAQSDARVIETYSKLKRYIVKTLKTTPR